MRNIMIKGLVIVLSLSIYFNVSNFYETKRLNKESDQLRDTIEQLEQLDDTVEGCNKLYEISINIVVEKDDLDETVTHCTNKPTLGEALDEITAELEIVYDPNYDKDYIYGRLVHSFYGVGKVFEEYYEITIDGERASYGVDLIDLEDGKSYEFTLVRWS